MTLEIPRLLLIDSYDSFTHNLAALCRQAIPNVLITIIKNDDFEIGNLLPYLPYFSAIIVGPGPGSPEVSEDVGVVRDLWKLKDHDLLPIFGLAIENGAILKRLKAVKHGLMSSVHHRSMDLFDAVGSVRAVRYHSLHVKLKEDGEVEELAWAHDEENGKVVMAIRHKYLPFWAVQYHPESVCTEGGGVQVLRNFWRLAQTWTKKKDRSIMNWNEEVGRIMGKFWPYPTAPAPLSTPNDRPAVIVSSLLRPEITVVDACEAFGASNESSRFALLESASQPGRYSILACISSSTLQITYRVGDESVTLTKNDQVSYETLGLQDIWSWLGKFMHSRAVEDGSPQLPFWGGLVGCLSYELGVHSLHIPLCRDSTNMHPDVNFIFVERSIVFDSHTKRVFVQSLKPDDHSWVARTVERLENLPLSSSSASDLAICPNPTITIPNKNRYISNIQQAKEHLYAGDSYELCLTAQTQISIPSSGCKVGSASWQRYKKLRKANPAPHSAYLRLHPTTLLSSSPERFLSYSRPPDSICTVRKAPYITRSVAEKALIGNPKEVAENLMIVDLIRHDLHGVVGEDVEVKQFCSVEEYETVWQLVSVIEGRLCDRAHSISGAGDQLGWRVLKESLPPGSMTGAPKKRSVEILQQLESQERGIYSGVFGYWCVGGSGDWSVTIRSCFKYDESAGCSGSREEWVIGAGGAITALSDPASEWDEMTTKLQSVLRAFGALSSSAD
ncbi:ADC synthase [Gymnopilus junonius]|uniref:aminodeoxychorismate synthase n=1 Tax=Gymnopilus junonius TaxID=109634 RepID=A0A9P5P3S0_GYMJU|nr:ADC synthase [Gymnopilus junonius]